MDLFIFCLYFVKDGHSGADKIEISNISIHVVNNVIENLILINTVEIEILNKQCLFY